MDEPIESAVPCPGCGGKMQWMQVLDGSGPVAVCPTCSGESIPLAAESGQEQSPPAERDQSETGSRFRHLLSQVEESSHAPLPEDLLEDLPQEAQALLSKQKPHKSKKPEKELREDIAASLRDQGYVISHDGQGIRISGELSSSRADQTPMSPFDIVRIAADLEGGVMSADQRRHCTKCEAVIPVDDDHCQMCGEPAPPPASPE